jgi:hypothetical protein
MKEKTDPSGSSAQTFSRRAALRRAVMTGLVLSSLPALADEAAAPTATVEPAFIPENDYPYFGYDPGAQ